MILVLGRIVQKHAEIVHSKLRRRAPPGICTVVTATLFDNRDFLCVIIDYVMAMRRANHDMARRIMQFTIGLKRIIHTSAWTLGVLPRGVSRRPEHGRDDEVFLYAQFESAVLAPRRERARRGGRRTCSDRIDEILKRESREMTPALV